MLAGEAAQLSKTLLEGAQRNREEIELPFWEEDKTMDDTAAQTRILGGTRSASSRNDRRSPGYERMKTRQGSEIVLVERNGVRFR